MSIYIVQVTALLSLITSISAYFPVFYLAERNHRVMKNFTPASIKMQIRPEDLERIDVRVGTITGVRDIAESNKLLCLTVDFGDRNRNVLVGMKKERNDPAQIVGTQALFVVNLEPRVMFGHVSEAMLFDIGYQDGIIPVMAIPENPVPNGARAG